MIIRTCIGIPTYNNEGSIIQVVLDCLRETPFPIFVIDDGSDIPVERLWKHDESIQAALAAKRLRVSRFDQNRGKGAAIQHAFAHCASEGLTHLVTIDGDGQHFAGEITKLTEVARKHPWDLIIGSRKLVGETIPNATKFGRRFSNFWVGFQTGEHVGDSQSGFRLYPIFRVQNMRFFTRRYDFEIEVLIRLLWGGVGVHEVEIDVYYPPKNERVSHFDKLWDNARISCLNTALVAISLLKSRGSPARMSIAFGLGVLIGCTPFFGFHTLIAAAFAMLFRMNALVLLLGTQISIPPLAPFLAIASIRIGNLLAGSQAASYRATWIADAAAQSSRWLVGSLCLGAGLGACAAIIIYTISSLLRAKTSKTRAWNGKTRGGAIGNALLKVIARRLGLRTAYLCLYFIVPYFYLFAPKARKAASEYWRIQRPKAGLFKRQALIFRQLFAFGQLLLDRVFQGFSDKPCFETNPSGIEHVLSGARDPRGLIMLSAHMGGWDLAASLLPTNGFSGELHLLQYEASGLTLNKVAGNRGRDHLKQLGSHGERAAAQPILRVRELLSKGSRVAIMGDRPISAQYELVSILGKLAPIDTTAFRIAAACGAPMLFTFGFKARRSQVYDFYAFPAKTYVYAPGEDKTLKCLEWAQEFADALEHFLKLYPEQWSNFFTFWSALPSMPEGHAEARSRNSFAEELIKERAQILAPASATKPIAAHFTCS